MICELCPNDDYHEGIGERSRDHSQFLDCNRNYYIPHEILCFLNQRWGEHFKLELGAGKKNKDGPPWGKKQWATIGLNERNDPNCDLYKDLDEFGKYRHVVIPLPDNCVGEIWACQLLEHIRNIIPLMNDCYRVLVPGGFMHIEVPYYLAPVSVGDPTHVRQFSEESFKYYCRRPDGTQFAQRFSDYGITAMFVPETEEFFNGRSGLRVVLRKPAQ